MGKMVVAGLARRFFHHISSWLLHDGNRCIKNLWEKRKGFGHSADAKMSSNATTCLISSLISQETPALFVLQSIKIFGIKAWGLTTTFRICESRFKYQGRMHALCCPLFGHQYRYALYVAS